MQSSLNTRNVFMVSIVSPKKLTDQNRVTGVTDPKVGKEGCRKEIVREVVSYKVSP